jgi:hypothetical protein
MEPFDSEQFGAFIAAKSAVAVHFDAEWISANRAITRRQMGEAKSRLGERVNFLEVDCDVAPELAKSIPILNVRSVAYYADGKLIAVLIRTNQNVRGRLERICVVNRLERMTDLAVPSHMSSNATYQESLEHRVNSPTSPKSNPSRWIVTPDEPLSIDKLQNFFDFLPGQILTQPNVSSSVFETYATRNARPSPSHALDKVKVGDLVQHEVSFAAHA